MTDYWLSKLLFDLQSPQAAAEFKQDRALVLDRYPLSPEARTAVNADDIAFIAPRVNAYLLRYYFSYLGMKDPAFIGHLRRLQPEVESLQRYG
jgi:hypothetical protein